jgi:purine-cytosine permease-like protein
MSFLTIGINLSMTQRRAIVAAVSGVIGLAIGIYFRANVGPGSNYENFLLVIAYWIGPWLGVVLTDYWMRKGNFGDESVFYDRGWNTWKGFAAMLVGGAVAIFIFADQTAYLGPFPKALPQFGDLTFLVAFLLAGVLYFAFHGGKITVDARGEEKVA